MTLRSSSAMIFETFKDRMGKNRCNLSVWSLCLGSMCIGLTLGWPEGLRNDVILRRCGDTCVELYSDGRATIRMIVTCGNCVGALLPSCIADTYGRRVSFAVAGALNFAFWAVVIGLHENLEIIFVSTISGIAAGSFVATAALYVSEISLPQTRATISALATACAYIGVLLGGCLIFVGFLRIVSLIMICLTCFFLVSLHWWMVESPYYFFLQGKTLDAKVSLKTLRGANTVLDIDPEYKTIELFFHICRDTAEPQGAPCCCSLTKMSRKRRYALSIIIVLCMTQMVSAYGMNDYLETFLSIFIPRYGNLVITGHEVMSVVIWLCLIGKINRKRILFVITGIGASVSCLTLGIFTLIKAIRTKEETVQSNLFPAMILALYYTIYGIGLTPILPILTVEIFPSRCKTTALCLCISLVYLISMIIQFAFEMLSAEQGADLAFVAFAIFGSLGVPFALVFLPEFQSKTIRDIHEELDEYTVIFS